MKNIRGIQFHSKDVKDGLHGNRYKNWRVGVAPPTFLWNPMSQERLNEFQPNLEHNITMLSLCITTATAHILQIEVKFFVAKWHHNIKENCSVLKMVYKITYLSQFLNHSLKLVILRSKFRDPKIYTDVRNSVENFYFLQKFTKLIHFLNTFNDL